MSLDDLIKGGNIVRQDTARSEIQELLRVAARSIHDANIPGLSPEGRFALAYDAALELATVPLRCSGYRTRGEGHHWAVFSVLAELMGEDSEELVDYLQTCRSKRSMAIYHRASVVSKAEADELCKEAERLDIQVRKWLKANFPHYS